MEVDYTQMKINKTYLYIVGILLLVFFIALAGYYYNIFFGGYPPIYNIIILIIGITCGIGAVIFFILSFIIKKPFPLFAENPEKRLQRLKTKKENEEKTIKLAEVNEDSKRSPKKSKKIAKIVSDSKVPELSRKLKIALSICTLAIIILGGLVLLYHSLSFILPPAESTAVQGILSFSQPYHYMEFYGVASILIPSGVLFVIHAHQLEGKQVLISKIINYLAFIIFLGIIIPIDISLLLWSIYIYSVITTFAATFMIWIIIFQSIQLTLLIVILILTSIDFSNVTFY